MKDQATNIHYIPDNKLIHGHIGRARFYLVIEGNMVGPFVQIGRNSHIKQLLLERGVKIDQIGK